MYVSEGGGSKCILEIFRRITSTFMPVVHAKVSSQDSLDDLYLKAID